MLHLMNLLYRSLVSFIFIDSYATALAVPPAVVHLLPISDSFCSDSYEVRFQKSLNISHS